MTRNLVHRFAATGAGTPVNAYLVEGRSGIVVVDATLTVSDGRGLRRKVDAFEKPLLGVVITHAHPDHYGGLVELTRGLDVPVFATEGVASAIRRDDSAKEEILRPMVGDEWATERAFPDQMVRDGAVVALDGVRLRSRTLDLASHPTTASGRWLRIRPSCSPPTWLTTAATASCPMAITSGGCRTSHACGLSSRSG